VGAVGANGAVWAAMLCRIPSIFIFLNDARIYLEVAVLWHGVADMSCFALPCFRIILY